MTVGQDIWQNFTSGIMDYGLQTFAPIDPWFYPLVFVGLIGYVYTALNSVIGAVVAILLTFAVYGASNIVFPEGPVSGISMFLYIIVVVGVSFLLMTVILKYIKK